MANQNAFDINLTNHISQNNIQKKIENSQSPDPSCPNSSYKNCFEFLRNNENIEVDKIIELRFKGERYNYYYNSNSLDIQINNRVVVEAERGNDMGLVTAKGLTALTKSKTRKLPIDGIKKVIRISNEEDLKTYENNKNREEKTFTIASEKILKHNLTMKLVDVEYQHDSSRITIYYTADHRIDFRELVKDLAYVYKTRIEMRQIGVRDETRRVGGIGICGRQLCCKSWLRDFERISTQFIAVQGLSFNPIKLSGQCSRLKCCLMYELANYADLNPELFKFDNSGTGKNCVKFGKIDFSKNTILVKYSDGRSEHVPLDHLKNQNFK